MKRAHVCQNGMTLKQMCDAVEDLPDPWADAPQEPLCPLCQRPLGTVNIDRHHLVPKTHGGKVQEPIHKMCHRKIHASFTEKELEKRFHTWEALRAEPVIQDFIAWVQGKDPGLYIGSDESASRKGKRRR